ncbi:MAG: PspC domain-containing protein [Anaerolineae bacterium]|jgi:phage shock protein C|nr:PspC domain-containing protein [Anaerolineae bacterium]MBT3713675.1 PspC domain-containing protein [Anaerolineae bacterium]MBT4310768.1 PspC domain-containing protein [Anaerolineae bacterium]MBT4458234.1 PspC domain-containing protein [Anaerolineae bacterium]MBT4841011.1 PspC domain-containing protein [Anaerolineae bacterium]
MTENYKRLYRNLNDIMLTGVCSGIAEYANLDPTIVRLLFVTAFFITGPGILLAYLIMMAVIPPAPIAS